MLLPGPLISFPRLFCKGYASDPAQVDAAVSDRASGNTCRSRVAITRQVRALQADSHGRPPRALSGDARFFDHARAAWPENHPEKAGAALLHSATRRDAFALRLSPRARRRAEELGGAQGAEPRPRRQAARGADRGS